MAAPMYDNASHEGQFGQPEFGSCQPSIERSVALPLSGSRNALDLGVREKFDLSVAYLIPNL